MNQRWRQRRTTYRPKGEPIDTRRYGVEVIPDDNTARRFIREHHYSGSYPAARFRCGLFRMSELVGVAVFSQPMNQRTIPKFADAPGVELGRFVLLDDVEANGETWFLARCFRLLRQQMKDLGVVIAYSDPVERHNTFGELVKPGHVGTIYQAFNGHYCGRARAENLVLDDHGRVISRRTLSKLRNDERGADAAYRQLIERGAPRRKRLESGRDYVTRALKSFRRLPHPGNLSYAWPLGGTELKPPALPYLKTCF